MARDIVISAGIKFNPEDVDTKAIKDAIVRTLANTELSLKKVTFGADAKSALQDSFSKISFAIKSARIDSSARTQLQDNFARIAFVVQNARFGVGGINGLKDSINKVQLRVENAKLGAEAQKVIQNSFKQGQQVNAPSTPTANINNIKKSATAALTGAQSFQQMSARLQDVVDNTTSADRAQQNFLKSLIGSASSAEGFGLKIGQITSRFTAYLITLKAILVVQNAFRDSISVIFEFDSAIQDLQKVLQTTPEGLTQVSAGLFQVANATGKSVLSVATAFNDLIRTGVGSEEALRRTEAAMIGVNATGLSLADSTKLISEVLVVFNDEIKDATKALDILAVADTNSAASSAAISQGILRSGSAAEAVGINFKQLTAITAATIEATQLSGSTIGSALKTIFANLAKNEVQLRETANAFGANIESGDSFFEVLRKLSVIFPTLGTAQKSLISQQLAGSRRFTELTGLLSNFGKAEELVEKETGAAGTALQRNQNELDKLSTKVILAKNAFIEFIVSLSGVDRGAQGVSSIRGTFASILDLTAGIGNSLAFLVNILRDAEVLSVNLGGVFGNLIKAGFFVLAPGIISGIASGLKSFFTISLNIPPILNQAAIATQNIGKAQGFVNEQTSKSIAQNRELLNLKKLQVASTNVQIANQAVNPLNSPVPPARGGGGGILQTGAKIGAVVGILTGLDAISGELDKTAAAFAQGTDEFAKLSLKTGQVAINAASLGIQFGLLAGGIPGLVLALGKFVGDVIAFDINLKAGRETSEAGAKRFNESFRDAGFALRTGSSIVVDAFNDVKQTVSTAFPEFGRGLKTPTTEIANNLTLASAIIKRLGDATTGVNRQLDDSTHLLSRTIESVAQQIRAVALDKEIAKVRNELRGQAIDLQAQIKFGDTSKLFEGFRTNFKQIFTETDFKSAFSDIPGTLAEVNNLLQASNDFTKTGKESALQLLQAHGALGPVLEGQITRKQQLLDSLTKELSASEAVTANDKIALQVARDLATQAQSDLKATQGSAEVAARYKKQLEDAIKALKDGEGISDRVNQKIENERKSFAEINKIIEEISKGSENRVEVGNKIIAALAKEVELAGLLPDAIRAEARSIADNNIGLKEQLDNEGRLASIQLGRFNVLEERKARQIALTIKSQEEENKVTREFERQIVQLKEQADAAEKFGRKGEADAINKSIAKARATLPDKLKEIREKASFELKAEFNKQNIEDVKKAEGSLLQTRLEGLRQIAELQIQNTQNQITQVKELSKTTSGRNILEREFKPTTGQINEFGFTGSIIASLLTKKIQVATKEMGAELDLLKDKGVDDFRILETTISNQGKLAKLSEESVGDTRNIILDRLKDATDVVAKSEADLVEKRNKIPALNGQVIEAEKNLSVANQDVEKSTDDLRKAFQNAADAQFKLNSEIALAEFKARQATDAFNGTGSQLSSLNGIFQTLTTEVKASSSVILEVRRQIIQEEISLLQGQFNTVKGLAVEAATGGPEAASKISQQIGAAQAIAHGAPISSFSPELIQGIDRLFGVIDGLQQAVTKQGLAAIGLPTNTLAQLSGNITQLSKQGAETGKTQVDTAVDQIRIANIALEKSESQRQIAQQNLELQRNIRDSAVRTADIAAQQFTQNAVSFSQLVEQSIKQLNSLDKFSELPESIRAFSERNAALQGEIISRLDTIVEEGRKASGPITSDILSLLSAGSAGVASTATGSLGHLEFTNLLSAANRERSLMPAGSRLMLANTSEVVLTRRQAQMFGLAPKAVPNAVLGNPVNIPGTNTADALTAAINALLAKLGQPGFVQQNINVQLDQNRTLEVKGLDGIETAVRNAFEARLARFATDEEVKAMSDVVQSLVSKLGELGVVNAQGF